MFTSNKYQQASVHLHSIVSLNDQGIILLFQGNAKEAGRTFHKAVKQLKILFCHIEQGNDSIGVVTSSSSSSSFVFQDDMLLVQVPSFSRSNTTSATTTTTTTVTTTGTTASSSAADHNTIVMLFAAFRLVIRRRLDQDDNMVLPISRKSLQGLASRFSGALLYNFALAQHLFSLSQPGGGNAMLWHQVRHAYTMAAAAVHKCHNEQYFQGRDDDDDDDDDDDGTATTLSLLSRNSIAHTLFLSIHNNLAHVNFQIFDQERCYNCIQTMRLFLTNSPERLLLSSQLNEQLRELFWTNTLVVVNTNVIPLAPAA